MSRLCSKGQKLFAGTKTVVQTEKQKVMGKYLASLGKKR